MDFFSLLKKSMSGTSMKIFVKHGICRLINSTSSDNIQPCDNENYVIIECDIIVAWRKIMTEYTPMIQQYLKVKNDYPDSFLFFRLGDFYELFFEDAIQASRELEITLTGRAGGGEEKIPMCGVPYHSSTQYIRKLIEKGHKVAICEQVEDPKSAKGVVKREVTQVITPGTLMDQTMLPERENNYILFLASVDRQMALIACDLSTGEVIGTETNQLDSLIDEAAQFYASETIITGKFMKEEQAQLTRMFKSTVSFKEPDAGFSGKWKDTMALGQDQKPYSEALSLALQIMIQYLDETQKRSIEHLQPVQFYQSSSYLKLDTYSRRNLELTETIRDHSKKGSLLWLLDETSTAMGGRLIKKWIQRPLMNQAQIEERLQAVTGFVSHSFEREELTQQLDQVYDLERLAARVSFGNVNPRDLIQLKKSLQAIPEIIKLLQEFPNSYLQPLVQKVDPCEDLVHLLGQALVDDPPLSIKDGGIFKSGYDEELDRMQEASRNGKQWIADLELIERKKTGIKSLKVGYNKVFGYYIEVTRANLHLLEDGRYERKQTLTNAERYITPELKEKEALILEANDRLTDLEYQLFLELRSEVNQYINQVQKLAEIVAQIDVFISFARVSEKFHYVQPSFSQDGSLAIKQGRHPVVEKVLDSSSFVANDLFMDSDRRQILLITGPNMAGKSTYMRQVALISIMAQIGCFVPADEATLPLFDQIFTRIGAADDLVGGQSTFMVEMLETKQAITQATSQSLILLDEIGRGTSTYDGISLAQAVVEFIHDHVQAKTLFSTHYHELTELEQHLDRLTNVHVVCSEKNGKVIFLHTVKEGKADQSYGIHVAQLANMPEEIIVRANEILSQLESHHVNVENQHEGSKIRQEAGTNQIVESSDQIQFSFFDEDQRMTYLKEIESLNLVTMTPLEALNTLYKIQQSLKK
jgi:DNA mismatch repair protein MutS